MSDGGCVEIAAGDAGPSDEEAARPPASLETLPPEVLAPIVERVAGGRASRLLPLLLSCRFLSDAAATHAYADLQVALGHARDASRGNRCLRAHAALAADPAAKRHYAERIRDLDIRVHLGPAETPVAGELCSFLERCTKLRKLTLSLQRSPHSPIVAGREGSAPDLVRLALATVGANAPDFRHLVLNGVGPVHLLSHGVPGASVLGRTEVLEILDSEMPAEPSPIPSPVLFLAVRQLVLGAAALDTPDFGPTSTPVLLPDLFPNLVSLSLVIPSGEHPPPLESILPRFRSLRHLEIRDGWNVHPRFLSHLPPELDEITLHSIPLGGPWLGELKRVRSANLDNCLFDVRELSTLARPAPSQNVDVAPEREHRLEKLRIVLHDAPLRTRTRRLFEAFAGGGSMGIEVEVVFHS
ncbi:hypothetical protein DFJ74DRAFT_701194 [Hyaloraphidium curvatum]|nr:hypothetical protein DFJ74DRAFT_701194 [Hyaloraphidium curvatum]